MPTRILPSNFILGVDKFKNIDNNTEQMAINGSCFQGEDVWDGSGISDSGIDWTHGGSGTEQTYAKHSGTKGLDSGVLNKDDIIYFDYGSDRNLESNYNSISFWVNIKIFPINSQLYCYWSAAGNSNIIGNQVNVNNYISNLDFNVWKRVIIPLSDFNLNSSVGRFIIKASETSGQQYYFDDIDMLTNLNYGPYIFRVNGEQNKDKYINRITLLLASDGDGWNSNAFANIANGLELGIILRQIKTSTHEIIWSMVMKNNMELFCCLPSIESTNFANNEIMFTFSLIPEKSSIFLTNDNSLEFIIRDDLSTIINMRAYLQYGFDGSN